MVTVNKKCRKCGNYFQTSHTGRVYCTDCKPTRPKDTRTGLSALQKYQKLVSIEKDIQDSQLKQYKLKAHTKAEIKRLTEHIQKQEAERKKIMGIDPIDKDNLDKYII